MNALLLVLLFASLLTAVPIVLSNVRRGGRLRTRRALRMLGILQLVVGALWVLWGAVYLGGHGPHSAGGWYAIFLGLLWCWQALRRLLPAGRR